jgi:hypothetical protein
MADMLTNTVGVMLFILIFTVLTAGGAVIAKRLPMERETKAEAMTFLCAFGRISPVDFDQPVEEFLKPLGTRISSSNVDAWVAGFNSRKLDAGGFVVSGEAQDFAIFLHAVLAFRPKPMPGETPAEVGAGGSRFLAMLNATRPDLKYVNFYVYPDGLTVFRAARDIASSRGFGTGWTLYGSQEPIRLCLAGCGPGGGRRIL